MHNRARSTMTRLRKQGDRVFVYIHTFSREEEMSQALTTNAWTLLSAKKTVHNGVTVTPVNCPQETPIHIVMDRVTAQNKFQIPFGLSLRGKASWK